MNRQFRYGFTIVELLIVIVVIAILAAITIVAFNGIQARAQYSKETQDFEHIRKLVELYKADKGYYPDSSTCNNVNSNYQSGWCGWDQGNGDSFIPGLVPTYANTLPTLDTSLPRNNTYLYKSSASTDGSSNGTMYYELIRYNSDTKLTAAEESNNPNLWTGDGYDHIAWGFKSIPSLPHW